MLLYNKDSFEILPFIPQYSIDLIITDLSYNHSPYNYDKLFKEYKRVINSNGLIVLFTDKSVIKYPIEVLSDIFNYTTILINKNIMKNIIILTKTPLKDIEKIKQLPSKKILIDYFIKNYTKKCNTILDNFMKNGETAMSCMENNRLFIGIELDNELFKLAEQNIIKKTKEVK